LTAPEGILRDLERWAAFQRTELEAWALRYLLPLFLKANPKYQKRRRYERMMAKRSRRK
jgi:hypothetical protein